jgi:hypothetical protein
MSALDEFEQRVAKEIAERHEKVLKRWEAED